MTAEEARARAKHMLGMLASGQDPKPPRSAPKAQTTAQHRPVTFGQLCSMWLAEHQKRNVLPSHPGSPDRWFSAYIVPELGDIPAADLDADAVREFHGRYSRIPHTANCMLRMISSVWSFGEPKHVPVNANPCWTLVNGQKKWCVQFYSEGERPTGCSQARSWERIAQAIIEFQAEGQYSRQPKLTCCGSSCSPAPVVRNCIVSNGHMCIFRRTGSRISSFCSIRLRKRAGCRAIYHWAMRLFS